MRKTPEAPLREIFIHNIPKLMTLPSEEWINFGVDARVGVANGAAALNLISFYIFVTVMFSLV